MSISIKSFIHKKIVVLEENASAYDASRAMCDRGIGTVVATDGKGHVTGILTDRDLSCALVAMNQSPETEVREIMTTNPSTVPESASVADVVTIMKSHGIRRVPVVRHIRHGYQKCVGLISLDDLTVAKLISLDDLSEIIKFQIAPRKNLPWFRRGDVQADPGSEYFLENFKRLSSFGDHLALSLIGLAAGLVVRRLHFTQAAELISHLPTALRSELLDLPAGPDQSIHRDRVIREITERFDVDEGRALDLLRMMWTALEQSAPTATCAEIAEELPDDLKALFVPLPAGKASSTVKNLERQQGKPL